MLNSLSLCLICKNEEKNIANLLNSVKGSLFDEIVIVDTGSTDKTIEIINNLKLKQIKLDYFEWVNDFSAARNFSFSKATSDYIMWLDADDIIKPSDYKKLLDLKKRLHEAPMWLMKYEYAHDYLGNSICSFYRERIVRRDLKLQWAEPIHEYLPLVSGFKTTDIEIHHNQSHATSDRNIPLLEEVVRKNPNKARNVFYLGKELFDVGKLEESVKYLEKFIYMPDAWSENKYSAFQRLSHYYKDKKNYIKAKDYLLESVREEPLKADAYCNLGELCMAQEMFEEAVHWYKIASNMERPSGALDIVEPKYTTWLPHLQLCLAYNNLGNIEKAAYHNEKALRYMPDDPRMRTNRDILKKTLKNKFISYDLNPHIEKKDIFKKMKQDDEKLLSIYKNDVFNKKVGWYCYPDWDAGTIRIRMLNINKYLKKQGYDSELFEWEKALSYDIVIMKSFVESDIRFIEELQKNKIKVICDMSEDILFSPIVQKIMTKSDLVICCSYALSEKVKKYNNQVITIEDALE